MDKREAANHYNVIRLGGVRDCLSDCPGSPTDPPAIEQDLSAIPGTILHHVVTAQEHTCTLP